MSKEIGKKRETLIIYSPRFMLKNDNDNSALEEVRKFWEEASGRMVEVNMGDMGEVTVSFKDVRMLRQSEIPREIPQERIAI